MKKNFVLMWAVLVSACWHVETAALAQTTVVISNPPAIRLIPSPSDLGLSAPLPSPPVNRPIQVRPPQSGTAFPNFPVTPVATAPGPLPPNIIAWDGDLKESTLKAGEVESLLTFNFTNVSSSDATISHVQTSCGCTTPRLPQMPWKIAPGAQGQIPVVMNMAGRSGTVFKTITVNTDKGWKMLTVKTTIPPPSPTAMTANERLRNQQLVLADRQAVFKGDCARCHVEPVIGKLGKDLYTAACGICHEAEHRAEMVPDLNALNHATSAEYWKHWITHGKAGSLMPAFAHAQGGPLSDAQIASLVNYLVKTIPSKAGAATPSLPATTPAKVSHPSGGE
ncbi:MAG: DUF1573 domain-containing protein [Verrucomicrobia bacterium]|nr:DUF1573 domain-containing protein [Verrucomicrobiota bacterium]